MSDRLTTSEARIFVGSVSRSTLYKWYADCKVATTGSAKKPGIAWDRAKLEKRRAQIARQASRQSA